MSPESASAAPVQVRRMRWWLSAYPQITRLAPHVARRAVGAPREADFSTSASLCGDQRFPPDTNRSGRLEVLKIRGNALTRCVTAFFNGLRFCSVLFELGMHKLGDFNRAWPVAFDKSATVC